MIAMLVGRCHVADSNREVVAEVVARLKPGAWEKMSAADRCYLIRQSIKRHRTNRELYVSVMRGQF